MINRICGCLLVIAMMQPAMGSGQAAAKSSPDIVWNFDEAAGARAHDAASGMDDAIEGFWRRVPGVSGQRLEFDGYTTGIAREGKGGAAAGQRVYGSAWVALNNFPWNWAPIVDDSDGQQVGYFVGIDAFGHIGFDVSVNGVWRQLETEQTLPLKKWVHVTAVFNGDSGLTILVDGKRAASLKAPGTFWPAPEARSW